MFVCCRANDRVQSAPEGAGGESSNDADIVGDSDVDVVGLQEVHANDCLCGIISGNDSNNYLNSDQQDHMDHLQDSHQLILESLNMVEAFAGVGAFNNGWRKLGNKVIGMFEWDEPLSELLLKHNPDAIFDLDFYKTNFSEWLSVYEARDQGVHVHAGGPKCTPYAAPGMGLGTSDSRSD